MARTADLAPPTYKAKTPDKQLSRTYIEQQIERLLEVFFESSDKSMGAGKCPFCGKGRMQKIMKIPKGSGESAFLVIRPHAIHAAV